jgi:hypothetical protein
MGTILRGWKEKDCKWCQLSKFILKEQKSWKKEVVHMFQGMPIILWNRYRTKKSFEKLPTSNQQNCCTLIE